MGSEFGDPDLPGNSPCENYLHTPSNMSQIAVITWSALQSHQRFFTPYTPSAFLADWLINVGAVLFSLTIYSNAPLALNGLLLLPAIAALLSAPSSPSSNSSVKRPKTAASSGDEKENASQFPHKPFLAMYRGSMMVLTCAAILSVDFRIFPRRFAKVENWGTSLMDLGVGSFVFSAGVVSARGILATRFTGKGQPLLVRLRQALRHSLSLLGLGIIRLLSVKGVDYVEHVTEYGVHWNFFITLGLLPPFVALFQSLFAVIPSYPILALILGSFYEILLDFTNLTAYIISAPRDNIISQNREGICSFAGYLAIFLAGQGAGMHVLLRDRYADTEKSRTEDQAKSTTSIRKIKAFLKRPPGKLLLSGCMYTALFVFTTSYRGLNLRVSRRLANLPYILWTSALNCILLPILMETERFFFPSLYQGQNAAEEQRRSKAASSRVLYAFNRNGLALFLLANLLTGAVNLTLPTLEMKTLSSMGVLIAYMAILSGVALGLDVYNIDVKI
jgi:glucosaminylphosphatidylinositol acyltransferase